MGNFSTLKIRSVISDRLAERSCEMASRIAPRRYMELLTPLLHRRFVKAAGVALGVCYAEAILIGEMRSCEF